MPYEDVIDMYSEIRTMQIADKKMMKKKDTPTGERVGNRIYIPAGDDWF